jgi:hypothetical protein
MRFCTRENNENFEYKIPLWEKNNQGRSAKSAKNRLIYGFNSALLLDNQLNEIQINFPATQTQ